jgi:hypothetical protein
MATMVKNYSKIKQSVDIYFGVVDTGCIKQATNLFIDGLFMNGYQRKTLHATSNNTGISVLFEVPHTQS